MPNDQLQMDGIHPLLGRRFLVRKRDGRVEEFNEVRIFLAIESAFKSFRGIGQNKPLADTAQSFVKNCADKVVERVLGRAVRGEKLEVERIQDAVEDQLMLTGHIEVARCCVLYRDQRQRGRAEREGRAGVPELGQETGSPVTPNHPEGVPLLSRLESIYRQALPKPRAGERTEDVGRRHFDCYLNEGDYLRCLTPALLESDSEILANGLRWERDSEIEPAALEILYDHFLAHENGRRIETPQYFWMRVALGLALREGMSAEEHALRFYEAISTSRFVPSEAILHCAGTPHPALTSCDQTLAANTGECLEIWHRDFLDRLDPLEEPSPKFDKALWIPDLFMKRVRQGRLWTLFDPVVAVGLKNCSGAAFAARYLDYEHAAGRGEMGIAQQCNAEDVWREIMAYVTNIGGPAIVFKDAARNRGLACPTGAVNLAAHLGEGAWGLDIALLRETITAAVRMLDNAIDTSVPFSAPASAALFEYRPIGLGIVGFNEALARLQINPGAPTAADFVDWSTEFVSHCAISTSAELARERGFFPRYAESQWNGGVLPIDTAATLSKQRGALMNAPAFVLQDWDPVRAMIRSHGMRNGMIMSPDSLDTRIAGIPSAVGDPKCDLFQAIEFAARRQKWMDADETLTLQMKNDPAAGPFYMQAWEKGIRRIQPKGPTRKADHAASAGAPEEEMAATV